MAISDKYYTGDDDDGGTEPDLPDPVPTTDPAPAPTTTLPPPSTPSTDSGAISSKYFTQTDRDALSNLSGAGAPIDPEIPDEASEVMDAIDTVQSESGVDEDNLRSTLQGLGRLFDAASRQQDTEMQEFVGYHLKRFEDLWTDDMLQTTGLTGAKEFMPDDPGLFQRAMGRFMGIYGIGDVLEYLAGVGEGFNTALALAIADDSDQSANMLASIGRGLAGRGQDEDLYGLREKIDTDEDGVINAREMLGLDSNFGEFDDASGFFQKSAGYGVGFLDTLGLAVTDASSWVGLGAGAKAKAGLDAVEAVGGAGARAAVQRGGLMALTASQRADVFEHILHFTSGARKPLKRARGQVDAISNPNRYINVAGGGVPTPLDPIINRARSRFGRQYDELAPNASGPMSAGARWDRSALAAAAEINKANAAKAAADAAAAGSPNRPVTMPDGTVYTSPTLFDAAEEAAAAAGSPARPGTLAEEAATAANPTDPLVADAILRYPSPVSEATAIREAATTSYPVWVSGKQYVDEVSQAGRSNLDDTPTTTAREVDDAVSRANSEDIYDPNVDWDVYEIYGSDGRVRDGVPFSGVAGQQWDAYFENVMTDPGAFIGYSAKDLFNGAVDYVLQGTDPFDIIPHGFAGEVFNPHSSAYYRHVQGIDTNGNRVAAAAGTDIADSIMSEVPTITFVKAITEARTQTRGGRPVKDTVHQYTDDEYFNDMRRFLSADKKSGYAIKADGDLVSVFNVGESGLGDEMVRDAVARGATKLDAFDQDGFLTRFYSRHGFKEVGRDTWDPKYKPEGWDEAVSGTPDVVYMELNPAAKPPTLPPLAAKYDAPPLVKPKPRPEDLVEETGWYSTQTRGSIGDALMEAPVAGAVPRAARAALGAISPRAAIRRLSPRMERMVDELRVKLGGKTARLVEDIERKLLNPRTTAAESLISGGHPRLRSASTIDEAIEEADTMVRQVLEGGIGGDISAADHAVRAIRKLRDEGYDDVADYAEVAVTVRTELNTAAVAAGLDDMVEHYFPRILTKEGMSALRENPANIRRTMGFSDAAAGRGEFGFQKSRTEAMSELMLTQINERFDMYVPEGTQFFTSGVIEAFQARGAKSFQGAVLDDGLQQMSKTLVDGVPVVLRNPSDAELAIVNKGRAKGEVYVELVTPSGKVFVPEVVRDQFDEVAAVIRNDKQLKAFMEVVQEQSKIWGSWATSPLIDGVGFHSRNGLGNILLNAAKGIVNPKVYTDAAWLQVMLAKANRISLVEGIPLDEALRQTKGLSSRNADRLLSASDNEILNGLMEDLTISDDAAGWLHALGNNKLITSGRALGNAIEDNARLAHYIHQLDQGLSTAQAAKSVRHTLFDYGDLTGIERALKYGSRFYTFMRKNTGFQLWALARYPGRVGSIERAMGQAKESGLGVFQPGYSSERLDSLVDPLGLTGLVGGFETPFSAAADTLRPFLKIPDMVAGNMSAREAASDWMNLTSGGPKAFIDLINEAVTGVDPFTGAPTSKGDEEWWRAAVDALVGPAWTQLDSAVKKITEGEGVGFLGNTESTITKEDLGREAFILSNIIGMRVSGYGPDKANNNMSALQAEVLKILEDEYPNSATVEQLRRADVDSWDTPESESRPQREILEENIEADRAAGLDTSGLDLKLRRLNYAEQNGLLTPSGDPSTSIRAKSHWNRDNPNEPFLDKDGAPYSYAEWAASVEGKGHEYETDGTYTSRSSRGLDLASELNVISALTGEPTLNVLVKAEYNRLHPDDPFLNPDDEPYEYRDVPHRFPGVTVAVARDWLIAQGADINPATSSLSRVHKNAYNQANPNDPYREPLEWIEAGQLPLEGVYTVRDPNTGAYTDYYPAGMSADNWKVGTGTGTGTGGRSALGASGTDSTSDRFLSSVLGG